jgi:hypothetical protein
MADSVTTPSRPPQRQPGSACHCTRQGPFRRDAPAAASAGCGHAAGRLVRRGDRRSSHREEAAASEVAPRSTAETSTIVVPRPGTATRDSMIEGGRGADVTTGPPARPVTARPCEGGGGQRPRGRAGIAAGDDEPEPWLTVVVLQPSSVIVCYLLSSVAGSATLAALNPAAPGRVAGDISYVPSRPGFEQPCRRYSAGER